MKLFPVFLDLRNKKILIVGGGFIAAEKIQKLLGAGGILTVVAIQAVPQIVKLARQKKVKYFKRSFRDSDLKGRDLIFSATGNDALNRRLQSLCRERRIWLNAADVPGYCSFILPAVFRRGDLAVALSTGGASPAAAKFLKKRLESLIGKEAGDLVKILKNARPRLMQFDLKERRRILKKFLSE